MTQFWINLNFAIYLAVFGFALIRNFNFNIILVGCIYLAPLIPFGFTPETAPARKITSISVSSKAVTGMAVILEKKESPINAAPMGNE